MLLGAALLLHRPLDREIANTQEGLRGAVGLMGTIATVLVLVSVVALLHTRQSGS